MKKQQGDVIIRGSMIPDSAKRVDRKLKGFVLAEGEATGHAHVIEEEIELYEKNGVLYIKTDKPVTVKHEEHRPITLDKGTYRVNIVREYDPFEEEVRAVQD